MTIMILIFNAAWEVQFTMRRALTWKGNGWKTFFGLIAYSVTRHMAATGTIKVGG